MSEPHSVVGWVRIAGASAFALSTDGQIKRIEKGHGRSKGRQGGAIGTILTHSILKSGYPCVNLRQDDGSYRVHTIHSLLGKAFLKRPSPEHTHVAHLNGDKRDFRLSNLRWKTPKENAADTAAHGRKAMGNRHGNTKIPDELLPAIRNWKGRTLVLAQQLGVSSNTITRIKAGTERFEAAKGQGVL